MTGVFHLSVYLLAALASITLTFAEEFPLPTGLTLPLACAAWYWNEHKRTVRFGVMTSNILGVVAFCLAGLELFGGTLERQVLAGAHLITYLMWVALFQAKAGRQYWWLLALSVMQVAIASILTERGTFGILLIVYVFGGMWTLAVYSVYQACSNFEQATESDTPQRESKAGREKPASAIGMPLALAGNGHVANTPVAAIWERIPMHRQEPEYRSAIQLDPDQKWINSRFIFGVITTAMMSLVVGLVFFTMVPRLWVGQRTVDIQNLPPLNGITGFTDEVQLGNIGQILQSNRPVLQAWFYRGGDQRPLTIDQVCRRHGFRTASGEPSELLFRGSVMGKYENGRWSVLDESRQATVLQPPQPVHNQWIRQEYILENTGSKTLFGVHPIRAAERDKETQSQIAMDVATSILTRDDGGNPPSGAFKYVVYSYSRGSRGPVVVGHDPNNKQARRQQAAVRSKFRQMPQGFEKLSALAKAIANTVSLDDLPPEDANLDPINRRRREAQRRYRIANKVQDFLGNSPDYTYTLDSNVVDHRMDPVEDFLINRKEGHCEYYASAMALMLRSLGIETRLVSGFKGGEFNKISGAFVVSERHAHAWVEVLIDVQWMTFDPTPAARSESVREIGEDKSLLDALSDVATGLWHQRIVRLSIQQQSRSIYQPIGNWAKQKLESWGPVGESVAQHLSHPSGWFSWQTFVAVFLLALTFIGLRRLWRKTFPDGLLTWLVNSLRFARSRLRAKKTQVKIDFYERFARILAKAGLTRRPQQTPLEFAEQIQESLCEKLVSADLSDLPNGLSHRFYEVRYGNKSLSESECQELEDSLHQLELALARDDESSAQ